MPSLCLDALSLIGFKEEGKTFISNFERYLNPRLLQKLRCITNATERLDLTLAAVIYVHLFVLFNCTQYVAG